MDYSNVPVGSLWRINIPNHPMHDYTFIVAQPCISKSRIAKTHQYKVLWVDQHALTKWTDTWWFEEIEGNLERLA